MDYRTKLLKIENELNEKFKFQDLGLNAHRAAEFILENPGMSPCYLFYQAKNGQIEIDDQIRKNLSSLIGYTVSETAIAYTDVVLLKTITEDMLKAKGCFENATLGDLRKIAKTIHPNATIIDEDAAVGMWDYSEDYYILKYLLSKRGVEIPHIDILSSCEESDKDESNLIHWNSSGKLWHFYCQYETGHIQAHLPIFCHYVIEGSIDTLLLNM